MNRLAWSLTLAGVALGGGVHAQAPRRLPVIAGNGAVTVLVELDGTVKIWGHRSSSTNRNRDVWPA